VLFKAGVSAPSTPVTWSRFQVRGPTVATTLTPPREATGAGLSLVLSNAHLEHLGWKLAYNSGTFGVTAGESTP